MALFRWLGWRKKAPDGGFVAAAVAQPITLLTTTWDTVIVPKVIAHGVSANRDQVLRELAFLMHLGTHFAVLQHRPDQRWAMSVMQACTDGLVRILHREGAWPTIQGPRLSAEYTERKEQFLSAVEAVADISGVDELSRPPARVTASVLFGSEKVPAEVIETLGSLFVSQFEYCRQLLS